MIDNPRFRGMALPWAIDRVEHVAGGFPYDSEERLALDFLLDRVRALAEPDPNPAPTSLGDWCNCQGGPQGPWHPLGDTTCRYEPERPAEPAPDLADALDYVTALEGQLWREERYGKAGQLRDVAHDLRAHRCGATERDHEIECPSCGATIRARMADQPDRDLVAAFLAGEIVRPYPLIDYPVTWRRPVRDEAERMAAVAQARIDAERARIRGVRAALVDLQSRMPDDPAWVRQGVERAIAVVDRDTGGQR